MHTNTADPSMNSGQAFGLMHYNARWSALGHMAQADTLVPSAGNPMAWDRYTYVETELLPPKGDRFKEAAD